MFNLGVSRKPIAEKSEFQRQYTGNWVWRAVAALIEDEGEYPTSYFVEKLATSELEIEKALSGLEDLGIIRRTSRGYKKVLKFIYYSDRNLDAQKLLSDHILISTQILGRLTTTENSKIFYRTSFVGTTEKKFTELCQKIESVLREFLVDSSQSPPEKVYALSLSTVDLTREENAQTKRGVGHEINC